MSDHSHNCETAIEGEHGVGWLTSGFRKHSERVRCACGIVWVHDCDEAEGCTWFEAARKAEWLKEEKK